MTPIRGLFETHLSVRNLERSIAFYRDVLKLPLAHVVESRRVAFFWIGDPSPDGLHRAMLGLWEASSAPIHLTLHTAFETSLEDILKAPQTLRAAGITPLDLDGNPSEEPVVIAWMPAASIYFADPDGNLLEFLHMLPGPARPELGIVPFSAYPR